MQKILLNIIVLVISLTPFVVNSFELIQSKSAQFKVELVTSDLGVPWGMAFITDDKLLITERGGRVRLLNLKTNKKREIKNLPGVFVTGQGGLLDVAVSPDYNNNGWIYFTYVKEVDESGVTVLARSKLKGYRLEKWQNLLVSKSGSDTGQHFGSRIAFDENGHVFFGIGDRGHRPNGQDLTNHAGSILRLNLDGSVPKDNPFIKRKDVLPEIWSYGHRNPQGLIYDFDNNRLLSIEHGPRGGDEINLIHAGKNYGWPVISYGKEYWGPLAVGEGTHREGMEQPIKIYTPSIAPGSLMQYTGNLFPNWKGSLFAGALKLRHINRVVINNQSKVVEEERLLQNLDERIRNLVQSPGGLIYFSTDSGKIYRIKPVK